MQHTHVNILDLRGRKGSQRKSMVWEFISGLAVLAAVVFVAVYLVPVIAGY